MKNTFWGYLQQNFRDINIPVFTSKVSVQSGEGKAMADGDETRITQIRWVAAGCKQVETVYNVVLE